MQFLDEAKIYLSSGTGGNGCVSFRREKYVPEGGPDGGDGGRGADVIVRCVPGLNTLIDFRYQQHFKGKNGESGKGKNRSGKSSDPLIIKVPPGTQIFAEDGETLLLDMVDEGQESIIATGGDGGFGNARFKTSTNQAPRKFIPGWPGEEMWVWLRLKLICDVGLLGLPNAGKSTLLAKVSAARPKIADYPFTTLKPQLGVVAVDDNEFVMADLPGLIAGAHEGVGLGHRFLKHTERCRTLLHLIDGTVEDVVEPYVTIRHELEEYGNMVDIKNEIIVINKIDAIDASELKQKIKALKKVTKNKIMTMSGVSGEGVTEVMRELYKIIKSQSEE